LRPEIHVYANPTIDYIRTPHGGWRGPRPGGPGLYAARLLGGEARVLVYGCHGGEEVVVKGYGGAGAELASPPRGMTTVFHLLYVDGAATRRLVMDSFCGEIPSTGSGEAALLAPVYREASSHHVAAITSTYPYVVVDVQGYARRRLPDGRIAHDPAGAEALLAMAGRRENIVFKLGIDDLGAEHSARLLLEAARTGRSLVLTMGYRGLLAAVNNNLYYVEACGPKAEDPTGLGDGFTARLLLGLLDGLEPLDAVVEAAEAICRYLGGRRCTCMYERVSAAEAVRLAHWGCGEGAGGGPMRPHHEG